MVSEFLVEAYGGFAGMHGEGFESAVAGHIFGKIHHGSAYSFSLQAVMYCHLPKAAGVPGCGR
jgi:hypothetical protein